MAPKSGRAAGGRRQVVKLTPKAKAAAPVKPADARKEARQAAALAKAQKAIRQKTLAKTVERNAGNMVERAGDLRKARLFATLERWEQDEPELFKHVADIVENGMIEQDWRASREQRANRQIMVRAGVPAFCSGAKTWAGLKVEAAKVILGTLLNKKPEVVALFNTANANHLKGELAPKAVRYLLGVTPDTDVPWGHELAECTNVLAWLAKRRCEQIGMDITGIVLENLDRESDWYLEVAPTPEQRYTVFLNVRPPLALDLSDFPIEKYDDWEVLNPDSYEGATLHSVKGRIAQPLWMKVPDENVPVFNTPFHFEGDDEPLGFPAEGNFTDLPTPKPAPAATGANKGSLRSFKKM